MTEQQENKLWIILTDCCKNKTPDLQSFIANIKDGQVFVDCHDSNNVVVDVMRENKQTTSGTQMAMWNLLRKLKIDVDTIEI